MTLVLSDVEHSFMNHSDIYVTIDILARKEKSGVLNSAIPAEPDSTVIRYKFADGPAVAPHSLWGPSISLGLYTGSSPVIKSACGSGAAKRTILF